MRRPHGAVDIRGIGRRHHRPGLAGRGVDALEGRGAIREGAVDIVLEPGQGHRTLSLPPQLKAGITLSMNSSSDRFLRSKDRPLSIHRLYWS